MTRTDLDLIVVGSGVVGSAIAAALVLDRRKFTWITPATVAGTASVAAGAMLGVLGEVTNDSDLGPESEFALRVAAGVRYPSWVEEIVEATRAQVAIRYGTFMVGTSERASDVEAMQAIERAAAGAALHCDRVTPADVPGLAPAPGHEPDRALAFATEGWIDPSELCAALAGVVARSDCTHQIVDSVESISVANGRIRGVVTRSGRSVSADEVVLCVGAETQSILARTPELADAVPRMLYSKGVGLLLSPPRVDSNETFPHVIRTPNRHYACGIHVVPRANGAVYIGATNRVSRFRGVTGEVTTSDLLYLLAGATTEISTELEQWNLAQSLYGYRSLSSDGLPVAGRTEVDGLSVATGGYRNGVLLAPVMAEAIVRDLQRSSPDSSSLLSPLCPTRRVVEGGTAALQLGLKEFESLFQDPGTSWWLTRRGALLAAVEELAANQDLGHERLRAHAAELMNRYPRPEMVPELLFELLQIAADPM
jgi:glycine oxidase